MDTPVSNPVNTYVPVPCDLYFGGKDYDPRGDKTTEPPTPSRMVVVQHRARRLERLRQLQEKYSRVLSTQRSADEYGLAAGPADLMVSIAEELSTSTRSLATDIAAAHARWLANQPSSDETAPVLPAGVDSPTTPAGASRAASAAAVVVAMERPSSIGFPGSVAFLSRQAQVMSMRMGF